MGKKEIRETKRSTTLRMIRKRQLPPSGKEVLPRCRRTGSLALPVLLLGLLAELHFVGIFFFQLIWSRDAADWQSFEHARSLG